MNKGLKYFLAIFFVFVAIALFTYLQVDLYSYIAGIVTAVLYWVIANE